MNKQLIVVTVAAAALFAGGLAGGLALTGGDSGAGGAHTMTGGQTMTGPMQEMDGMGSMMNGHRMGGGQTMAEPTHEMGDDRTMPGMSHGGA
jgi:hypothetical protein